MGSEKEKTVQIHLTVICVVLMLLFLGGIGIGCYNLVESLKDPEQEEEESINSSIEKWNDEAKSLFASLNISVSAGSYTLKLEVQNTHDWTSKSSSLLGYSGLHFYANESLYDENYSYSVEDLPFNQYNLLGNMTLQVDSTISNLGEIVLNKKEIRFLNEDTCRTYQIGCWEDQNCYYHYKIRGVCIVIDEHTGLPVEWYRDGCTGQFESFEPFQWQNCSAAPSFIAGPVHVEVRSANDPYVYSLRQDYNIIKTRKNGPIIISLFVIFLSIILLAIPCKYFCKTNHDSLVEPPKIKKPFKYHTPMILID